MYIYFFGCTFHSRWVANANVANANPISNGIQVSQYSHRGRHEAELPVSQGQRKYVGVSLEVEALGDVAASP